MDHRHSVSGAHSEHQHIAALALLLCRRGLLKT
jgi:hypothetical protein